MKKETSLSVKNYFSILVLKSSFKKEFKTAKVNFKRYFYRKYYKADFSQMVRGILAVVGLLFLIKNTQQFLGTELPEALKNFYNHIENLLNVFAKNPFISTSLFIILMFGTALIIYTIKDAKRIKIFVAGTAILFLTFLIS